MNAERPAPSDFFRGLDEIKEKLEEINCTLAAIDVIAANAYQQGVEAGRAQVTS